MTKLFTAIFGLGNQEIFLTSLAIIFFALVIWTINDLMFNKELAVVPKLIWLAVILFFPFLGTLIYLFYGRSEKHLSNNR